jgi:hypothetical protein
MTWSSFSLRRSRQKRIIPAIFPITSEEMAPL